MSGRKRRLNAVKKLAIAIALGHRPEEFIQISVPGLDSNDEVVVSFFCDNLSNLQWGIAKFTNKVLVNFITMKSSGELVNELQVLRDKYGRK